MAKLLNTHNAICLEYGSDFPRAVIETPVEADDVSQRPLPSKVNNKHTNVTTLQWFTSGKRIGGAWMYMVRGKNLPGGHVNIAAGIWWHARVRISVTSINAINSQRLEFAACRVTNDKSNIILKRRKRSGNTIFICAANVHSQCNIVELLFTHISLTPFLLFCNSRTIPLIDQYRWFDVEMDLIVSTSYKQAL